MSNGSHHIAKPQPPKPVRLPLPKKRPVRRATR